MSSQQPMDSISRKISELAAFARTNGKITAADLSARLPEDAFSEEQIQQILEALTKQDLLQQEDDGNIELPEAETLISDAYDDAPAEPVSLFADYLRDVKGCSQPSDEEAFSLSRRFIEDGDEQALRELINGHLKYVIYLVRQRYSGNKHFMDLLQQGNMALLHAAPKFDYRKGVRFRTYLKVAVFNACSSYFKQNRYDLKLGEKGYKIAAAVKKLLADLEENQQPAPDVEEIAAKLSITRDEARAALDVIRQATSINRQIGEEEDSAELIELVQDPSAPNPEAQYIDNEAMSRSIGTLIPREARALKLYYGLNNHPKLTDKEAAEVLELTEEQFVQLRKRAERRLWNSNRYNLWKEPLQHD